MMKLQKSSSQPALLRKNAEHIFEFKIPEKTKKRKTRVRNKTIRKTAEISVITFLPQNTFLQIFQ